MPGGVMAFLDRPWGVILAIAGAFVLPLLLADLLGGGEAPRKVALVTTVAADRAPAQSAGSPRIPDLRPARALPRMLPSEAEAPAPPAPAPAPDVPASSAVQDSD